MFGFTLSLKNPSGTWIFLKFKSGVIANKYMTRLDIMKLKIIQINFFFFFFYVLYISTLNKHSIFVFRVWDFTFMNKNKLDRTSMRRAGELYGNVLSILYIYTIYIENYPFQHAFGFDFSFQKYP